MGEGSVPGRPHRVLLGYTYMMAKVHALLCADLLILTLLGIIAFMGPTGLSY